MDLCFHVHIFALVVTNLCFHGSRVHWQCGTSIDAGAGLLSMIVLEGIDWAMKIYSFRISAPQNTP